MGNLSLPLSSLSFSLSSCNTKLDRSSWGKSVCPLSEKEKIHTRRRMFLSGGGIDAMNRFFKLKRDLCSDRRESLSLYKHMMSFFIIQRGKIFWENSGTRISFKFVTRACIRTQEYKIMYAFHASAYKRLRRCIGEYKVFIWILAFTKHVIFGLSISKYSREAFASCPHHQMRPNAERFPYLSL